MAPGRQGSKQPCRQVQMHKAPPSIKLIRTHRGPGEGLYVCDTGNNQAILPREGGLHLLTGAALENQNIKENQFAKWVWLMVPAP